MAEIRQILGNVFEMVKSAPVEIRDAESTLVNRSTIATIGNIAKSLEEGQYIASVLLPMGTQIVQPITINSDGKIDFKNFSEHIIKTVKEAGKNRVVASLNNHIVASTIRSAVSAIPPNIYRAASPVLQNHTVADLLESLGIESQGPNTLDGSMSRVASTIKPFPTTPLDDAIYIRLFKDTFKYEEFDSFDPLKPLATSKSGRVSIENCNSFAIILQLLQTHEPALNLIIPPQSAVVVSRRIGTIRPCVAMIFGVPLVDELVELRTSGSLSEAVSVAQTLRSTDIIDIAKSNKTAAIAAAFILLRTGSFNEARETIHQLAATLPAGMDLSILTAELSAREGHHIEAARGFLEASSQGLPMFSTALGYLIDRLRFYCSSKDSEQSSTTPSDSNRTWLPFSVVDFTNKLKAAQPFALRCDFSMPFTNYTGLSPAKADDTEMDSATIVATGAARLNVPSMRTSSKKEIEMPEITEAQITEAQIQELTKLIQNLPIEAMGPKQEFCRIWPEATKALSALQKILAFVPGVSVFAGPALAIVAAAGDAASSAVCKKQ